MSFHRTLTEGGILSHHSPLAEDLELFLVQVVIILTMCRLLSILGTKLGQPKVIFEIVGGILLGPSAIGRNTAYLDLIFPGESLGRLGLVANIGLVLYLFIVGMELDPELLITHGKKAGAIAIIGMAVPFALGVAISRTMFDTLQGDDPIYKNANFVGFYVFIGTAMSITAFPVLARILKEEGLMYTQAGAMVMGAAAINDAVAWCLLILAISIASAGDLSVGGFVFLSVVAFAMGLFFIVRVPFHMLIETVESWHSPTWSSNLFAFTLCLLCLSAWTTALLGVHGIFGAFLFGLIIPKKSHLFKECNEKIEEFVVTMLLPIYFTLSGLKTDITQLSTGSQGSMIVLVCFIASIGKFVGAGGTALACGMSVRESSAVAVLMNTRGLVELIVLNLGRDFGLLNVNTFAVMVIMCLFTTFLTCPAVNWVYPKALRIAERDMKLQADADEVDVLLDKAETGTVDTGDAEANRDLHVGIVIDRLSDMEYFMRLVPILSPVYSDTRLSVVAIKLQEPTNSDDDVFLGLTENGRLIKVDRMATRYDEVSFQTHGHHIVKPLLLPLSLHCTALGCSVDAFQIKGDPLEFPTELKIISAHSNNQLMMFPWRDSGPEGRDYWEKLFWGTVRRMDVTVALVWHNSSYKRSAGAHDSDEVDETKKTRARSNSTDSNKPRDAEADILQNTIRRLSFSEQYVDTTVYDSLASHGGRTVNTSLIRKVVVVVTGQSQDVSLFPIARRIMDRSQVFVVVYVANNLVEFPDNVRTAYNMFKESSSSWGTDNISFVTLNGNASNESYLHEELSGVTCDVLLMSFIEPASSGEQSALPTQSGRSANTETRQRSHSLSAALAHSMSGAGAAEDLPMKRRMNGMPVDIANNSSHLDYPELGTVCNRLCVSETSKIQFMIVLHESVVKKLRRTTLLSNTTAEHSTYEDNIAVEDSTGTQPVAVEVEMVAVATDNNV